MSGHLNSSAKFLKINTVLSHLRCHNMAEKKIDRTALKFQKVIIAVQRGGVGVA